jgi:TolB protein
LENVAASAIEPLGEYFTCDSGPNWSPDSQQFTLSFMVEPGEQPTIEDTSRCEIHLYDLQSKVFTRLTHNNFLEGDAAFSPDGKRLVLMSAEDGYNHLYIVDVNSGTRTLLTLQSFGYRPAWSPDGGLIAFMANHEQWNDDIYVIAPDGSGLRHITTSESPDDYPEWVWQ